MSSRRNRIARKPPATIERDNAVPHRRVIQEAPLPNWPILMATAMAARYLSLDENSFALVTQRAGVRPVDLGLAMVRWRRSELDRFVNNLPGTAGLSKIDCHAPDPGHTEVIVSRVVDELARRSLFGNPVNSQSTTREALGIKEVAHSIGVSRSTVYKLINEGRLPTTKIGGRVLVLRSDLEALLQRPDPEPSGRARPGRRARV